MERYPRFVPPPAIGPTRPREWTRESAIVYADWLKAQVLPRSARLLEYLAVSAAGAAPDILAEAGHKASVLLGQEEFSREETLTSSGMALAADLGLLIVFLLEREHPGSTRWKIVWRPKTSIDFQQPVLVDLEGHTLNPIGASIANATGLMRGKRGEDAWKLLFEVWNRRLASDSEK